MTDIDETLERVKKRRRTTVQSGDSEEEDSDRSDHDIKQGVVSGWGDAGDAMVDIPGDDHTFFIKGKDCDGFATPNDVVKVRVTNYGERNVAYCSVVEIVEQNREQKSEVLEDIAEFQGDDGLLNRQPDSNSPRGLSREGALQVRDYMAYLERQAARTEQLQKRLDRMESGHSG